MSQTKRFECLGTCTTQDTCLQCPDNDVCAEITTLHFKIANFAKWLESNDPKDSPLGLTPESTRGYIINEFRASFEKILTVRFISKREEGKQ